MTGYVTVGGGTMTVYVTVGVDNMTGHVTVGGCNVKFLPSSSKVSRYPDLSISMLVLLSNMNTGGGLVCAGGE